MSVPASHYEVLGIDTQADDAAIKRAYKSIALANHPDKTLHLSGEVVEKRTKFFRYATTAYEILLDPVQRADYNRTLAQTVRPSCTTTAQPSHQSSTRDTGPSQNQYQQRPKTAPKRPEPSQPPKRHPFTTGTPPGPVETTPSPWFYAPVSGNPTHTTLSFSNHTGWSFRIEVSNKYIWIRRPVLPLLHADTKDDVTIKISMQRNAYSRTTNVLKDVAVKVSCTPGNSSTAFSSIFSENRQGVELCFTIGVLTPSPTTTVPLSPTLAWTWSFDIDLSYLVPFYKELRVTHLMFYPHFPSHAVGKDGAVPAREPYPSGSPQAGLMTLFEGMQFVAMTKGFYCDEVGWAGRKLWRLAAVGSI